MVYLVAAYVASGLGVVLFAAYMSAQRKRLQEEAAWLEGLAGAPAGGPRPAGGAGPRG